MLLADTLIVMGMATVSLGTIQEADGIQQRTFVVRNDGSKAVCLRQGYTSCGCTQIHFAQDKMLQPRDTAHVTLRFNPRGKGGEFHEVGTLVYGDQRKHVQLTLTGNCVTSEETLLRQFPIRISDDLRLSVNRFDMGRMQAGQTKERTVVILHRDEGDRREPITIRYTVDSKAKGLQHIAYPIETFSKGKKQVLTIMLDVFIL